jgi:hypothetical protein
MSILHFRCKERRRTLRVSITVGVTVQGQDDNGEKFSVQTHAHSINRHGALLRMEQPVTMGQMLLLTNDSSSRRVEARVVSIRRDREKKTFVGIELVSPDSNFWHMTFPLPGARPLRRVVDTKASA